MKTIDRIELGKRLLLNADNMNMSKEILLKISQKLDKYIVEYYREIKEEKQGVWICGQLAKNGQASHNFFVEKYQPINEFVI